ncbi:MAG: uroporphyrinogen decarboxylase family protein [Candidatus Humimicrobiaceae bacterium]
MDDWGSNTNLLINPKIWRELFKLLYKEYCSVIHDANKFTFFHSDGNIEEIFGDLTEIGIDAINSQLFTMDIENIANNYKDKITFWGEIDRQHILAFSTAGDVYKAVMNIRHNFDDGNGGVIAQCEWGKDNSTENIEAVYTVWNKPLD